MARYDERRYWSSHNSYEGGTRGWVALQLDNKVRCVEFDIWDNDYTQHGDYRLGHFKPGHAVALGTGKPGENPQTLYLRDWLKVVADWSAKNAGHAPITIVLDMKSDLTDNEEGDLEDLNRELEKMFGDSLFTRDDFDATAARAWPESTDLRDRCIAVLSGNSNTRASYRYCFGLSPAIAVNDGGDVVLAYRSGAGDMRYWSGKAKLRDKRIEWIRKGTYAFNNPNTVSEPSVAITDDGWVVSVYRIGPRPNMPGPAILETNVGELQDDGWIKWHSPRTLTNGMQPTLERASATKLNLIYTTDTGKSLRFREGTLNKAKKRVDWKDAQATPGPAFPRDFATWKSHELRGLANARGMIIGAFDADQRAIGYRQVAFVELQNDEEKAEFVDPLFYGASAGEPAKIAAARIAGLAARAWWFKDGNQVPPPSPPQENWAGTDFPLEQWYSDYLTNGGQSEF